MIRRIVPHAAAKTPEQEASDKLYTTILDALPKAESDPSIAIWIVPNAKCFGGDVNDIDLLLLARFPAGIPFHPTGPVPDRDGELLTLDTIDIYSLAIVFEIKDHPPEKVRFQGSRVVVQYADGEKDASEQSHRQRIAVANYVRSCGYQAPFVRNLIWLRNVLPHQIPLACSNVLGISATWSGILQAALRVMHPQYSGGQWYVDALPDRWQPDEVVGLFTQELVPSRLDRKRMERLSADAARTVMDEIGLASDFGNRLILLRGRGGTGKTVLLLQIARRLYERENSRVLLLTYNHALVEDIRRLLSLLGLSDQETRRGIRIQTVHSYILEVYSALVQERFDRATNRISDDAHELSSDNELFSERYLRCKQELIGYLSEGVIRPDDLVRKRRDGVDAVSYDFVFVDEGQDWEEDERDLLFALYSHRNVVVADGIEQLVRRTRAVDWQGNLTRDEVRVRFRGTCLRMKANLARFVEFFARCLGLNYEVPHPNEVAVGGNVIIYEGDYFADRAFHDEVIRQNAADGNREIDMLFCVPPSLVKHSDSSIESIPGAYFRRWGLATWEGVSPEVRRGFAIDLSQHRIVQYESCRGLEGWVVVAFRLDDFCAYKRSQLEADLASGALQSDEHESWLNQQVAHWIMIPVTRAMDTLVIQIGPHASLVRSALEQVHRLHSDFVQWICT